VYLMILAAHSMTMNFIRFHIKEIRSGGIPVLWRKVRVFPRWCLLRFVASKYGSRATYCGCRIAAALKPDWAEAQALLAYCLVKMGRFDEAMTAWEQACLLKPDQPEIHIISTVFYHRGQTWATKIIIQGFLDALNNFAREHQLDKLGIRFLVQFSTAIGHIALLDSYVKMGILGQRSKDHPILLAAAPSNKCYLDYWRRYLPDMITDPVAIQLLLPFAKYLEDRIYAVMDSSGKQIYELYTTERAIQEQWETEARGPLLTLTDFDNERGQQCLRDLGVPTDSWFVSLHVRESTVRCARNADINSYRLAMESIAARGGWVIRMGDTSMTPLPPMPQVIDYAHSAVRSDWMDVFLWSQCLFFIGTQSGPNSVPPTFGVPCVLTNWSSLGARYWFNKDLCIYKLHWSKREARYLNFGEVISSALAWAEWTGYHASQGINIVDNTPEDINDVVVEMLDRLADKLQYNREDEKLQKRFDKLHIDFDCKAKARVGRDFLRKWAHLL